MGQEKEHHTGPLVPLLVVAARTLTSPQPGREVLEICAAWIQFRANSDTQTGTIHGSDGILIPMLVRISLFPTL